MMGLLCGLVMALPVYALTDLEWPIIPALALFGLLFDRCLHVCGIDVDWRD